MLETIKEQWPAILEHLKQEHDISDVSFKPGIEDEGLKV